MMPALFVNKSRASFATHLKFIFMSEIRWYKAAIALDSNQLTRGNSKSKI